MFAAESASTSSKRARKLFGSNPIPNVEDVGFARRRKQLLGTEDPTEVLPPNGSERKSTAPASNAMVVKGPVAEYPSKADSGSALALSLGGTTRNPETSALALKPAPPNVPTPAWHAPWKLSTVLSSHLGWVRCIAFDPYNRFMATGAADQVIKIFDFPKASAGTDDALQLTLTGHISAVRGLEFSERHPYLFSVSEDKTVKCWDLETNQVVRHYHGHLSGVYAVKLHPTLDILVTAGRDAVARVWDMRTKTQLHVLSGHEHTVTSVLTSSMHPQIITGSHDSTVKMWDLAAGKCFTTLTHHGKSIRGLADAAGRERSFVSASADGTIRKWQGKNGKFLKNIRHDSTKGTIWNAVAVQEDGVMVSGSDDGGLDFWDYDTGYCFQRSKALVQPGSLEPAENAVLCCCFDKTGTRLVTGNADKSLQIWKQDDDASELTHPIDMKVWKKTCLERAKERY